MKIDIPSLILAGAILLVAALLTAGGIGEDAAKNAFILLPLIGFAWSRREACRLRCPA